MTSTTIHAFADLASCLGLPAAPAVTTVVGGTNVFPLRGGPPAAMAHRQSNTLASAQVGVARPLLAEIARQCEQVRRSHENGGKCDNYDVWYKGHLTLACFCTDGAQIVHELSKDHPQYDPANVAQHFHQAADEVAGKGLGAPTCASYSTYRPGVCLNCPHHGKLNSPIALGYAAGNDNPPDATTVVAGTPPFFSPVPLLAPELHEPPYVIPGLAIRGGIGTAISQGAGAKTTFFVNLGTAASGGLSTFGPLRIRNRDGGLRVAGIFAEEDGNQLGILTNAAMQVGSLDAAERANVRRNWHYHDAGASSWALKDDDRCSDQLRAVLQGYDLVFFDNLAALLCIDNENNNMAMTALLRRLVKVAAEVNCAILIAHHAPKVSKETAAAMRGEVTLSRGGGAITNTSRAQITITGLTKEEAGIAVMQGRKPEQQRRVEHSKVNDQQPMEPAYFEIVGERVKTADGEVLSRAIRWIPAPVANAAGIPDSTRSIVMHAIQAGASDDRGARVPLSPTAGGNNNKRDPIAHIARSLMNANAALTGDQARTLARAVLEDLRDRIGCVVEVEVELPRYKKGGQRNGKYETRALECRWDLAPWALSPERPDALGDTPSEAPQNA